MGNLAGYILDEGTGIGSGAADGLWTSQLSGGILSDWGLLEEVRLTLMTVRSWGSACASVRPMHMGLAGRDHARWDRDGGPRVAAARESERVGLRAEVPNHS